jgi:hypothetical protein
MTRALSQSCTVSVHIQCLRLYFTELLENVPIGPQHFADVLKALGGGGGTEMQIFGFKCVAYLNWFK